MIYLLLIILIICSLLLFLVAPRCSEQERMQAYFQTMFAHRGYHCMEKGIPENSMSAFRAALDHNYGIELDLHLTKDGQLVVFHDDTLKRICGRPETVESLTAQELADCRLCNTDEGIPLFSDVLSLIKGRVPLLIELKIPTHSYEICAKTYQALQSYSGACLIQSFNTVGLNWFKKNAPEVLRGQLSSHLTGDDTKESWILKFMVEMLFSNFLGRPDFISYKLADLPHPSVSFLRTIYHTPVAVWTLRTRKALKTGVENYDIQIFEKSGKNY